MRIGELISRLGVLTADSVQSLRKFFLNRAVSGGRPKAPPRKAVLFFLCGFLLLVLLVLIGVVLTMNYSNAAVERAAARELSDTFTPLAIPPEDLFLPGEPDFFPEVLLEKEPQRVWTGEDARQFWRDPLQNNPERWRERMETAIDRLMERIP
jgi:hypothetical protein